MVGRESGELECNVLLRIERQQRQVQNNSKPVSIDDEEEGQESVNSGFGDNVGVETVAEVNGVDIVTANQLAAEFVELCEMSIQVVRLKRGK